MCIRDRGIVTDHRNGRHPVGRRALGHGDRQAAACERRRDQSAVAAGRAKRVAPVSYTHLRAHETVLDLVCRLLLEKKKKT